LDEFLLDLEIRLGLEGSSDLTPERIDPMLNRIRTVAMPVAEEFPELVTALKTREGDLRKAVAEARGKAQPVGRAEPEKSEEDALKGSDSPMDLAAVLLSRRFADIRASEEKIRRFLDRVRKTGGKEAPPKTGSIHRHADHQSKEAAGDSFLFFQGVIRLADLLLKGNSRAGAEEASARVGENAVFFLRADLFSAADRAALDELTLAGLGIDLREKLAGMEDLRGDLQIVLVTPENQGLLERQYAGWRIIAIRRKPGSDPRPLPVAAVPALARDALASGRTLFDVVVTPYLHLWDRTLEQELRELEAGTSA
jgi:hypothetical protein